MTLCKPIRWSLAVAAAACLVYFGTAQAKGPGGGGGGGGDSGGAAYAVVPFLPPDLASTSTWVSDLNDRGHVVGTAAVEAGYRAVHLDLATGVYTILSDGRHADGVNSLNQIVGSTKNGDLDLAVFWRSPSDTEPVPLRPFAGDDRSFPIAINDAGIVIGHSSRLVDDRPVGRDLAWRVVVDEDQNAHVDGPVELPSLLGGDTRVYDINDVVDGAAQIVGYSVDLDSAVVWTIRLNSEDGTLVAPGIPVPVATPGASWSSGHGINNLGDVCGRMQSASVQWGVPYVALAGEDAQTLPVPQGTQLGEPWDINDVGEVVGQLRVQVKGFKTGPGRYYACLWKGGKSFELNSQIAPQSGWDLVNAQVINKDGLIGGTGSFEGVGRGYVLIPNP